MDTDIPNSLAISLIVIDFMVVISDELCVMSIKGLLLAGLDCSTENDKYGSCYENVVGIGL